VKSGEPLALKQATPRSGTTIAESTQTTFKARQISGDETELSQSNPYVYDMRLQLHPNGLSGVITIVLGNNVNQGTVTLPSLTAVGDFFAS